ncbi:medium-chain fatty acid ethyl ester synthase/esteras-like protein 1 [Westerdykella ornata]|uniref:alcohol O-acetyltransferase n=1 Tax=Westerdykella ornata TaxID=318751 RepID=A0A6A6JVS0_WESOR|nr:medium-chain fatty acid ethyl ester synthase/esteras-like protein 1 [Westerdykella ornata]KAF2280487.1 medium-chain fatty acid ethyl ester synthase/esteras-like protein 1 [Westerdykella ornata]
MFDPSWLLGHARTTFTHATNTIPLNTKSGRKTTLSDLVRDVTPPCRLNPLLFNGHLQTMWTAVKEAGPAIYYKRRVFQSTHAVYPGQFAVDFVVPVPKEGEVWEEDESLPERTFYFSEEEFERIGSGDGKPMLVCLHGLSGGSHEVYLRHVVAPVTADGWECCVVNARGCAMSKITTPQLFNARATWDVRQTVKWLRKTFPNRPLYAVGFSLGANILTNYCAEDGDKCELKAAIACSNPWNLEVSHRGLLRSWLGMEVYQRTMGSNIIKLYAQHKDEMLKNPKLKHEDIMACRYLYEFDRVVQAPTWGYPTEGAYYRDAQSVDALTAIRIPFLGISAEDDPISSVEAIPYEEFKQNPYAVLVTTNWGGHLSWFQIGGKRWFASAVEAFLLKMHNDIDSSVTPNVNGSANNTRPTSKYPIWDPNNRRLQLPL